MHISRKTVTTLAILGAVVGLAGCGQAKPTATSETTSEQTAESTTEAADEETTPPQAAEPPAEPDEPPSDLTPPGTVLKVGETAILPHRLGTDNLQTYAITVTGVTQSDKADFDLFDEKTKAQLAAYTPWYLEYTIAAVDPLVDSVANTTTPSGSDFSVYDSDGAEANQLIVIGSYPPCKSGWFPADATVGTEVKACVPFYAIDGKEAGEVQWDTIYDDSRAYDPESGGQPVIWKF